MPASIVDRFPRSLTSVRNSTTSDTARCKLHFRKACIRFLIDMRFREVLKFQGSRLKSRHELSGQLDISKEKSFPRRNVCPRVIPLRQLRIHSCERSQSTPGSLKLFGTALARPNVSSFPRQHLDSREVCSSVTRGGRSGRWTAPRGWDSEALTPCRAMPSGTRDEDSWINVTKLSVARSSRIEANSFAVINVLSSNGISS